MNPLFDRKMRFPIASGLLVKLVILVSLTPAALHSAESGRVIGKTQDSVELRIERQMAIVDRARPKPYRHKQSDTGAFLNMQGERLATVDRRKLDEPSQRVAEIKRLLIDFEGFTKAYENVDLRPKDLYEHYTAGQRNGVMTYRFTQYIDGVMVSGGSSSITVTPDGTVTSIESYMITEADSFAISEEAALAELMEAVRSKYVDVMIEARQVTTDQFYDVINLEAVPTWLFRVKLFGYRGVSARVNGVTGEVSFFDEIYRAADV